MVKRYCDNVSQWSVCPSIDPNCPSSSSGDHTKPRTNGLETALQDQSEESAASFKTAWLSTHVATCPVQPLFTSSPMSMVTVRGPGLKVFRDLHHGRIQVSSVFFPPSFSQPSSWPWWQHVRGPHPPPAGWRSACGYAWICSGPCRRPHRNAMLTPGHQTPRQPRLRPRSSWTAFPAPSAPWARKWRQEVRGQRQKQEGVERRHLNPEDIVDRQQFILSLPPK